MYILARPTGCAWRLRQQDLARLPHASRDDKRLTGKHCSHILLPIKTMRAAPYDAVSMEVSRISSPLAQAMNAAKITMKEDAVIKSQVVPPTSVMIRIGIIRITPPNSAHANLKGPCLALAYRDLASLHIFNRRGALWSWTGSDDSARFGERKTRSATRARPVFVGLGICKMKRSSSRLLAPLSFI